MLTSAIDYEYVDTTGIEQGLNGSIIPTAEVSSFQAPFRFEDICYITEATKVWSYNYSNIISNPTYTQSTKYTQIMAAWQFIYNSMLSTYYNYYSAYGCTCFLNDSITQTPAQPRFNPNTGNPPGKEYFSRFAPTLLFDHTSVMDACIWQTQPATLSLREQPLDVDVMHRLYWILFQPCWQDTKSELDSSTVAYDKSYTFCQRGIKSGTGSWHTSDSGVINTHTGNVVNYSGSSGTSPVSYVQPAIVNRQTSQRVYYTDPMELKWYSWYSGSGSSYQSGYEYCYDGIDADAYAYIDFRRDDVIDAYAFVLYIAVNQNTMAEMRQYKFEPLT